MKYALIIIAIILTVAGIFISQDTLKDIAYYVYENPIWILLIGLAVVLQLTGHLLRAARTKLVLDQAAPSSLRFQFGALSIGYLFNTLLPLRLGELVRAYLASRRLRISLLYTFTAIIIERSIDVVFIGLIVLIGYFLLGVQSYVVLVAAALAVIVATALLLGLVLLKAENKYLLKFISSFAQLFNVRIANSIRFKVWSLIFGLQNFFNNKDYIKRYAIYALASWIFYIASAAVIIIGFAGLLNIPQLAVASIAPYVVSSTQPQDTSLYVQLAGILSNGLGINAELYGKVMWAVLILPMALVGVVALVLYKTDKKQVAAINPYVNKLLRYNDISQDFPIFLDTYFKGASLSRILHKIEVNGELSLVKFFKGGSDAITVLALKSDRMFVKKIVPAEYTDRLKVQYKWLKKQKSQDYIVNVIGEQKTNDYYAIDLEYDPQNIPLFEYIHTHSLAQSKKAISQVWEYVFKNLYQLDKESLNTAERDVYVQERLLDKIEKAIKQNDDLKSIITEKKIKVNGTTYDNFYTILDRIKNNPQSWQDLATYRRSPVAHGDLTIDNILINGGTGKPYIIDPSDDNPIRGPIIDLGRHTQSLVAGYEFLNDDDEPVSAKMEGKLQAINYHDRRSAQYMQLYDYFVDVVMKKYFTPTEQKTALFHAGLLYGRMLAHRVVINPANTLKYYAVCVVLLNNFYDQYK